MSVSQKMDHRKTLESFIHNGNRPAAAMRRSHMLLKADADGPDA
jgi:hypothetical protein